MLILKFMVVPQVIYWVVTVILRSAGLDKFATAVVSAVVASSFILFVYFSEKRRNA